MTDHRTIWLEPWCDECERSFRSKDGRIWCEDNPWQQCPTCGAMPVKYVIAEDQPKPEAEAAAE
jgi:rubrerythrin